MSARWRRVVPPIPRGHPYHRNPTHEPSSPYRYPYPIDNLGPWLNACRDPNSIATLKKLHAHVTTGGSHSDPFLVFELVRSYGSTGDPHSARKVFDRMPHGNAMLYNAMIGSYADCGHLKDAILTFRDMLRKRVSLDNYTFPRILKVCSGKRGDAWLGMQLHGCATKHGLDLDVFAGNALVNMYVRCGDVPHARHVFERMVRRDVVSWNTMIGGYSREGDAESALEMCRKMVEVGEVSPDDVTMASILPALVVEAERTSSREHPDLAFVRRLFEEVPNKGLVSWNAMIAAYVRNGMAVEAIDVFSEMRSGGVEPDEVTVASVLPACGDISALSLGERIHGFVRCRGMGGNLLLENALVDMYAKCGCLEHARRVFDGMCGRDVVSWTSLISAYGRSGLGKVAAHLFEEMEASGVQPDGIAFVAVLSACSHSGLLEEGRDYFRCMIEVHGIVPTVEHFACMVDLLGRSGKVEEAYELVKAMPLEANLRVWGALLNACQVYSDVGLGLVAADRLLEMGPDQAGYHVLLSNLCAGAGRWGDVASLRDAMRSKGVGKFPGCSYVEIGTQVHGFLAGDLTHPQWKEIYEALQTLIVQMNYE